MQTPPVSTQPAASASLAKLLTAKPSAFPFAKPSAPSASLFRKGGEKKLYNIIHNTNNPLNWFERMKQRQKEKPMPLNNNVGDIHRTIEAREQAMVAKSGSGDQRALGKLAAMDPVEYYKTRSGVLNLARSDPVLIKKIREASVPNDTALAEAVLGEAPAATSSEGGGGPPEPPASEGGAEAPPAAAAVGGGGAEPAEPAEPATATATAEPATAEPATKKELDKGLKEGSELDPAQLQALVRKTVALDAIEKMFVPLKSGNKDNVRDGLNYFMDQTIEFNRLRYAGNEEKINEWPAGLEIRKTTNAGIIGRLYVDGLDIDTYVQRNKEDLPLITEKLGKVKALFNVIQASMQVERKKEGSPPLEGDLTEEQILEIMDKEYPLLRGIFTNLQSQIDNSLKPFRIKKKAGRGKGVGNKPKQPKTGGAAMVETTLAGSEGGPATDGDTDD